MFNKRQILDFFLVLGLASIVFLTCISQTDVEMWEPWETTTILIARQLSQSSIAEPMFWVPQLDGNLVALPYLQLWSLATILHAFPDPDAFWLRLPGALVGILLVLMSFFAIRYATTRRTAWVSTGILLTLPMFVFGGKLLHGDIWLLLAVSLPNLFFILANYASTRRMHRLMLSFTALSFAISFLSGGLFALAILLCECILIFLFIRKHPYRKFVFSPLSMRYFMFPLYIAFVISGVFFGTYVTNARYALENRTPLTLSELNEALDEDRVISVERRRTQIIGSFRPVGNNANETKSFILVESAENLTTNATSIFNLNDADRRTFENLLMWRFQKSAPEKAIQSIPPFEGTLSAALRFFWYQTTSQLDSPNFNLARINTDTTLRPSMIQGANDLQPSADPKLSKNQIVRIIDDRQEQTEIEDGARNRGFVPKSTLTPVIDTPPLPWKWWVNILLYGLMPWSFFFPIFFICAFISVKKITVQLTPFRGEYCFQPAEDGIEHRSPFQSILLSWLIASIIALVPGIYHHGHDTFTGLIAIAALMGVAITSPILWQEIRKSLEGKLLFIAISVTCMTFAFFGLKDEPFTIIQYLLTNPVMHWPRVNVTIPSNYIVFLVVSIILVFISFTSIADIIQKKAVEWIEQFNKSRPAKNSYSSSSSASLMRVSRQGTVNAYDAMPYAPVYSLLLMGLLCSSYLYFNYLPNISDNFTETALITRYFELADQSESIYLLSGENEQLCQSYKDCDAGYICKNSHCKIASFSSYSLNITRPISREDMLDAMNPHNDMDPAFYIVPKDALYSINQAYRSMYPDDARNNLTVLNAPSARLFLIGNHKEVESINPLDSVFCEKLPENATEKHIALDENISIEGFRMDKLDSINAKILEITVFYKLARPLENHTSFFFQLEVQGKKIEFTRPLLDNPTYDETKILPGDMVADHMSFDMSMIPNHGLLDIHVGIVNDDNKLTTFELTTSTF